MTFEEFRNLADKKKQVFEEDLIALVESEKTSFKYVYRFN